MDRLDPALPRHRWGRGGRWAMMRRTGLFSLLWVAVAASPAFAQQKQEITVAIFAPNAPFDDSAQRFAYVQRLAESISRAPGVQATGKAFARASDFEAAA